MKSRSVGVAALIITALLGLLFAISHALGLRLNFTDSAPHGLWRVSAMNTELVKRGDWVEVCPPDTPIVRLIRDKGYLGAGSCAGIDTLPLLKPVAAVSGDTVHIQQGQRVSVNDISIPNTQALATVTAWPEGDYTVPSDEIWLLSSHSPNSFDSRYFGPVKRNQVHGIASPLSVINHD